MHVSGEDRVCTHLTSPAQTSTCGCSPCWTRAHVPVFLGEAFQRKNMLCDSLWNKRPQVTPESIRPADAVNTLYLSCGRTQDSQSSSLGNAGKWHFRCTVGFLCQWVLHPANVGAKILNKLYLYWTWVEFLLHFYGIRYHKLCRNGLNYSEISVQIIWK